MKTSTTPATEWSGTELRLKTQRIPYDILKDSPSKWKTHGLPELVGAVDRREHLDDNTSLG
ncbi:MAG: hypothetical protein KDM81_14595, partial [Verrucomicrobiae bacterium]|nr:hypothetical protein [Verrucomicrobiae bacterium]